MLRTAFREAFTNSTSRVIVTSSPTRMPPVSRTVFQVKPKLLDSGQAGSYQMIR
jgi:hypothetical protein